MNKILDLIKKYTLALALLAACCLVIWGAVKKHNYEKQILQLQNQIATSSKTVEDQKVLYEKLTVQTGDLKDLLNLKDTQIQELNNQINKDKDQLVSVTTAVSAWKKAYEGLANATQSTIPPTGVNVATRERVDFDKNFGYIEASGYTETNPPEAYVKVQQNRPLKFTVAVAQNKDKSWKTYATSSEDNVFVDIQVAGVNPLALEPRWYEKLDLNSQLGVGSGVLAGVGLGIGISRFTVGPNMWITTGTSVNKFYGINVTWHPFER